VRDQRPREKQNALGRGLALGLVVSDTALNMEWERLGPVPDPWPWGFWVWFLRSGLGGRSSADGLFLASMRYAGRSGVIALVNAAPGDGEKPFDMMLARCYSV
jgi:hypothetical protein